MLKVNSYFGKEFISYDKWHSIFHCNSWFWDTIKRHNTFSIIISIFHVGNNYYDLFTNFVRAEYRFTYRVKTRTFLRFNWKIRMISNKIFTKIIRYLRLCQRNYEN